MLKNSNLCTSIAKLWLDWYIKPLLLFIIIWIPIAQAVPLIATYQKSLQADFNQPTAIAISKNGQAYVLDGVNG
ncbi:MAG: hypothetical protein KAG43_10795, partial [Candidatus Marithrix sp.]|nr:hypothetical protein [Candidatus Marithrix sp.]